MGLLVVGSTVASVDLVMVFSLLLVTILCTLAGVDLELEGADLPTGVLLAGVFTACLAGETFLVGAVPLFLVTCACSLAPF